MICPICFEKVGDKTISLTSCACNSIFHAECIQEWRSINDTCPMCRKPILLAEPTYTIHLTRYELQLLLDALSTVRREKKK